MDLIKLGYDDWVASHAGVLLQDGQTLARVMTVERGAFLLQSEHGETASELSGKFHFDAEVRTDIPCVGDWVCIEQSSPTLAIIHAVLPRRTFLRRKTPGKTVDFQMIAANVDVVFIVQSCHYDFNIRRLERYLIAANEGGSKPILILTKTDLVTPEELEDMIAQIREAGISTPLLPISNETGDGLELFRGTLSPGQTFCLLGSSGVGKSTLINRLTGNEDLETRAVSETGEGAHTTTRRQLMLLEGGAMLIDTPGMRELGLIGASEAVEDSFSNIRDLVLTCRFSDCTHTQEPGCAIRKALKAGELDADQFQSYLKLKKETDFNDLSYIDKRKKDKNFGKLIKNVMKHKNR